MGGVLNKLIISEAGETEHRQRAKAFWRAFTSDTRRPKFVFGCNAYGKSILAHCRVDGFIDDFSGASTFLSTPIVKSISVPKDALVIAASGGRPLTVRRLLASLGLEQMDYFTLRKVTGESLKDVVFNEGYEDEFQRNETRFEAIYERLADDISRDTFRRLVSFRLNYNLDVLEGFADRQKEQYFEPFLELRSSEEVFIDVGCFDGFTSLEFMKLCPNYSAVHAFEPDEMNYEVCRKNFAGKDNVQLWKLGLSDRKATMSFSTAGSGSGLSADGEQTINVDRLDDILNVAPTLIKIDTEGSECPALRGASRLISTYAPRLAISAYHDPSDFWRIPDLIFGLQDQYDVFLRHYTECIYESVMSFVPRRN